MSPLGSRSGRRFAWLAVALVIVAATSAARAESPEELFNSANRAYDDRRYDEAVQGYETLLRYQIEDPRLEYNLGNAEFRRGNIGAAILHYERARRLDPTDPDVLANLRHARSVRIDRVPEPQLPAALAALRALQDRLGPRGHAWIVVALVWLIAALLAHGAAAPGKWRPAHGWGVALLAAAIALSALSWSLAWQRLAGRPLAVVLAERAAVLGGPGANNATLAVVHEGLDVEVRGERAEWVQVLLPNGVTGWIPRDAVGIVG